MPARSSTLAAELKTRIPGRPAHEQRLLFVGLLNRHLPTGLRAVLVGGCAVEFYTRGAYVTGDVDLIGDREAVKRLLGNAGFKPAGRHFHHEELGLVVEVPDSHLRPSESVVEAQVGDLVVPIVSVEDLLVDRLLAAKYWQSQTDWEQAILVYVAHRDRIDEPAWRRKATANDVTDMVNQLIEIVGADSAHAAARRPKRRGPL